LRFSILITSFLALVPEVARGTTARPTANLRYTRGEGAERCPEAETIRNAVAARLGRDPWDEAAPRLIIVAVAREGEGLRARVELRGQGGRIAGLREMTSPGRDCIELAAAVELAISIAIDPLSFTSPSRTPSDARREAARRSGTTDKTAREKPAANSAVTKAPARENKTRLQVAASIGGLAAVGSAPAVAGGITVQGRLRWGQLSLALEGRMDLPAYEDIPGGQVSSSLLLMGGVGCVHLPVPRAEAFGCGVVYVGALRGAGHDIARPERTTLAYATGGARLGVELPLYSILSLRVYGDLLATLTRITLRESGGPAEFWSTPPLSGAVGAAAVGTFR
jgi:hypothetical protein